jgi:hypothetical protein
VSKYTKVPENMQFVRFEPPATVFFATIAGPGETAGQFKETLAEGAKEHWESICSLAQRVASPEVYKVMLVRFQTLLTQAKSQGVSQDLVLGLQTKALDNIARSRHIIAKALEPYLQGNWVLAEEQKVQLQKMGDEASFQRDRVEKLEAEIAQLTGRPRAAATPSTGPAPEKREVPAPTPNQTSGSSYLCPGCKTVFVSKQALGGHRRHCKIA